MGRALLVAHQDVLDLVLLENLVIDRQDGAARIAEDVFDALVGQRPEYDFRARQQLVGVARHILFCVHHLQHPLIILNPTFGNKKGPVRDLGAPPSIAADYSAPGVRLPATRMRFVLMGSDVGPLAEKVKWTCAPR
jgi:hypothetical protein